MSATSTSRGRDEGPPPAVDQEVAIEGLFPTVLVSIVETVSGDLITVSPPRIGGVELPLGVRQEFTLSYRVRSVRCEVSCVVVREPSSAERVYVLRMMGTPRRIQRRGEVRVPTTMEVVLRCVPDGGEEPPPPVIGTTVDLSVGGVHCVCDSEFKVGEMVSIILNCADFGALGATIEVIRCSRDADTHAWRIGARFAVIDPGERRRLSAYLLDRQRLLRRREVGLE